MNTKIEGIVLSKTPYQERHLIAQLLMRNGKKISILFYGGVGGGKNKKSSIVELGHLLEVELSKGKITQSLGRTRDWVYKWAPEKIRNNHQAYYGQCFFLEIVSKLAGEYHPDDDPYDNRENEGLFRVLSNALFHMDKDLVAGNFSPYKSISLFLGKLMIDQGIFPQIAGCSICGIDLSGIPTMSLVPDHGGFACGHCQGSDRDQSFLRDELSQSAYKSYAEYVPQGEDRREDLQSLWQYFLYQYQWQPRNFKTACLLF